MLAIISTHPIQYLAPVYRALQTRYNVPVTVIYGSDFSISGYRDSDFGATFAWDTDLLSGYSSLFLSKAREGGACSVDQVSARGLAACLDQLSPGVLLIGGYGHRFHRAGFRAAWRQRVPILFRAETNDDNRHRDLARRVARDVILRSLYSRCAKLLYIGNQSRRHFERLGVSDDKLVFSPYCVDDTSFETSESARERFRVATREALGIRNNQSVILFSGKLCRGKGTDLLLRVVSELDPDLRKCISLLFVGSGELREQLECRAKAINDVKVVFAGFKNQGEMSPYYHAADILALPSSHETWGLVVNEALHHGVPCVVSRSVGSAPDLVEPGLSGEVFETDSTDSLALAILRALELTRKPETRENCRRKVGRYSVANAARGIAEAYWAVVARLAYMST